jgi:hypothetical protein
MDRIIFTAKSSRGLTKTMLSSSSDFKVQQLGQIPLWEAYDDRSDKFFHQSVQSRLTDNSLAIFSRISSADILSIVMVCANVLKFADVILAFDVDT